MPILFWPRLYTAHNAVSYTPPTPPPLPRGIVFFQSVMNVVIIVIFLDNDFQAVISTAYAFSLQKELTQW